MFLAEASVPPHNIREGAAAIFPTFQLFPKIFYCTVIGMPTSDKIINGLFHFFISNKKIALKLTFHMIMDILSLYNNLNESLSLQLKIKQAPEAGDLSLSHTDPRLQETGRWKHLRFTRKRKFSF